MEKLNDGIFALVACSANLFIAWQSECLELLKNYLASFDNLQTIGRNGLHMYNNQDHSMLTAMLAVKNILGERHDLWAVNTERSYHEEVRL